MGGLVAELVTVLVEHVPVILAITVTTVSSKLAPRTTIYSVTMRALVLLILVHAHAIMQIPVWCWGAMARQVNETELIV